MCLVLWLCIALPKPGGLRDHSQVDEAEASAGIQLCVQVLSPCVCSSGAQPLATNTPGSCRAPAGGANLLCTASTSPSHCSSWPAALPCMARARLHTCPQSWGGEATSKNVPKRECGLLLSGCKLRGDTHVPTPPPGILGVVPTPHCATFLQAQGKTYTSVPLPGGSWWAACSWAPELGLRRGPRDLPSTVPCPRPCGWPERDTPSQGARQGLARGTPACPPLESQGSAVPPCAPLPPWRLAAPRRGREPWCQGPGGAGRQPDCTHAKAGRASSPTSKPPLGSEELH